MANLLTGDKGRKIETARQEWPGIRRKEQEAQDCWI